MKFLTYALFFKTMQRYNIVDGASGTFMHLCVLFGTFVTFLSWIAEVIEYHAYLASGEILAAAVIAG